MEVLHYRAAIALGGKVEGLHHRATTALGGKVEVLHYRATIALGGKAEGGEISMGGEVVGNGRRRSGSTPL